MPSYLNVYNTTFEDYSTQIKSKGYCFKARGLTKVPEEFDFVLPQFEKHGIVIINPGDDLKAKEKQGLMAYYDYLMEQRAYFNMYLDEKKRNGVTVDKPKKLQKIEQWLEEIKNRYIEDDFENTRSFKDEGPIDGKQLFAGEMEVKTVEEIVQKKRGPKSFKDVDITEEISN